MARTFPTAGQSPVDVYNTQVRPGVYIEHVVTDDGTERHSVELVSTATMASGGNYVNLNVVTTTAGTAAAWVSSIYAKITQGSTKNVNGYFCAAEFEIVNSAANVSDNFCLVLNYQNNGSGRGSHESYIAIRDYGSLAATSLFWIADSTIGTNVTTSLMSTSTSDVTVTHCVRFYAGGTPYWFLVSSAGPA